MESKTNIFEEYDYLYNDLITTTVIADSEIIGGRVTTFLVSLPRIVLAEMNTHRVFSRNVSSSRAVRFETLAKKKSFVPQLWIKNHKGMQGAEFDFSIWSDIAKLLWRSGKVYSKFIGGILDKMGYSKQYTNRLIEPYTYVDYLVTATDWQNFLLLRDDYAAQFEIQVVARQIKELLATNTPIKLKRGEWHIPFIKAEETYLFTENQLKLSVARCARTSYSNQKLQKAYIDDYDFHDRLWKQKHLSPFEHQVCNLEYVDYMSGNFSIGWQYRKFLERGVAI